MKLHAQVAIWHQIRGQRTLVEREVPIRLQLFQPDGCLEFAGFQLQCLVVMVIQEGVKNLHRASAEIRREIKVEVMEHRSGENRARPPEQKAIRAVVAAILENVRLSSCTHPWSSARKFESAEAKLKPF